MSGIIPVQAGSGRKQPKLIDGNKTVLVVISEVHQTNRGIDFSRYFVFVDRGALYKQAVNFFVGFVQCFAEKKL